MPLRPPRHCLAAAALAGAVGVAAFPAAAKPAIDGVRFDAPVTVHYQCDAGKRLTARYFNSPDNQIAIVRLDGKPLLFVSVLTGSGARYSHGIHQWITKGDEGRLQDLTQGDDAPPVYANCKAVK
ncbi:MliC family protein [Cupriavidus sp. 2TAF22]|uniref:MliC family protein n=1 Tax=unclassified Cupriavidus TaxID=2640874 RepID=UPI003F91A634